MLWGVKTLYWDRVRLNERLVNLTPVTPWAGGGSVEEEGLSRNVWGGELTEQRSQDDVFFLNSDSNHYFFIMWAKLILRYLSLHISLHVKGMIRIFWSCVAWYNYFLPIAAAHWSNCYWDLCKWFFNKHLHKCNFHIMGEIFFCLQLE